jgi:hypothetical protein
MSLYEKERREADAKLAELRKNETTRSAGLLGGDTVNSPLAESCVLPVRIYFAQSLPIGNSGKTAERGPV